MSIFCLNSTLNQWLLHKNYTALIQCSRTLFSEKILRIDKYETQRMRVPSNQFNLKRLEFALNTNNIDAVVHDTKQWIHTIDKLHCQMAFPLLQRCLRYIYSNCNEETMKQPYSFGPPVMRMMHFLNIPENALQINFDPQLSGMFQQLSCTLILCDLLFNNGMYQDVVHVVQRRRDELLEKGFSLNRHQICFLFGASYKLNTPKDFEYALEVWESCKKDHQLTQSINFLAMLAINQGQPQKALEILPPMDKHFSSVNVRSLAHSECSHFTEAIEIIENQCKNHKISNEVIARIKSGMEMYNLIELKTRLNGLVEEISQRKFLIKRTIDEILCWPVSFNTEYTTTAMEARSAKSRNQLKE